jgi:hypothetical protein
MNAQLRLKILIVCAACGMGGTLSGDPEVPSKSVSLIAIIANPKAYTGKEYVVRGYLAYQRDVRALFFSIDAFKHSNLKDSIWIDDSKLQQSDRLKLEMLEGKLTFAAVRGVIDGESFGPNGLYSAKISLTDIHTLSVQ